MILWMGTVVSACPRASQDWEPTACLLPSNNQEWTATRRISRNPAKKKKLVIFPPSLDFLGADDGSLALKQWHFKGEMLQGDASQSVRYSLPWMEKTQYLSCCSSVLFSFKFISAIFPACTANLYTHKTLWTSKKPQPATFWTLSPVRNYYIKIFPY